MKKNNLLILLLFGLVFSQTIYSQTTNITDSNGKKQGVWKKVDEKGNTKFEGTFVDDVPTGLFTHYYPNKKIKAKDRICKISLTKKQRLKMKNQN